MKSPLLVVAVTALIHGTYAVLFIKGPTEPVVEGAELQLECLSSERDLNNSLVRFERFLTYSQRWQSVYSRYSCFYGWRSEYNLLYANSAAMMIHAGRFDTLFRCVLETHNATEADNASLPFALKVLYMDEPSLSMEGFTRFLRLPQQLKMRRGDQLVLNCSVSSSDEPNIYWSKEGSDWILPSPTLTLSTLSEADEGKYTCTAEHPVRSLTRRSGSVSIIVLPEDAPWYETTNGRLILMTSAAAAGAALVAFVLFVSVSLLCRRARRAKTSRRPIDDRSQIQPIYRASVESLPSTCADKQPLV